MIFFYWWLIGFLLLVLMFLKGTPSEDTPNDVLHEFEKYREMLLSGHPPIWIVLFCFGVLGIPMVVILIINGGLKIRIKRAE